MPKAILLVALAACAGADAQPQSTSLPGPMTPLSEREASEVAKLRAEGRPALDRLLARYDALKDGAARTRLADTIDRVAAQRYATASRLFWHTDLADAKAEAQKASKPILSLRMLGRLDEDLSCANSRYFRIALYANTELSKFLRDNFVLHWSSERAVPRVTIDFGDGRKLERTITGNSIHYVLDADGHPLDALPGLYAPAVFQRELADTLALLPKLRDESARDASLVDFHQAKLVARNNQWSKIAKVTVPLQGDGFRPEAYAQVATITKSGFEMPAYRVVDLGVKIGDLPDDVGAWAQVGLRLMPATDKSKSAAPETLYRGRQLQVRGIVGIGQRVEIDPIVVDVGEVIDASSKALLARLAPVVWSDTPRAASPAQLASLVDRFERDILADTGVNEFNLRQQIHSMFVNHQAGDFAELNDLVYQTVFLTPKSDPWLGLAPRGITALPADGVVSARR